MDDKINSVANNSNTKTWDFTRENFKVSRCMPSLSISPWPHPQGLQEVGGEREGTRAWGRDIKVNPLNKDTFGTSCFVLYREVVLF